MATAALETPRTARHHFGVNRKEDKFEITDAGKVVARDLPSSSSVSAVLGILENPEIAPLIADVIRGMEQRSVREEIFSAFPMHKSAFAKEAERKLGDRRRNFNERVT